MSKHVIPPFAPLGAVPPPRRRCPSSLLRRLLSATLVVVLVVGVASPARAFLSVLDPMSWAVVGQMVVLISQMATVKRQIQNYRNQASTYLHGKLAPLNEGLRPLRMSFERSDTAVTDVIRRFQPDGVLMTDVEFNQPITDCGTPGFNPVGGRPTLSPCLPTAAVLNTPNTPTGGGLALTGQQLDMMFPSHSPSAGQRRQERINRDREEAALYGEERRRLISQQADIEVAMTLVEEWRGCRQVAAGAVLPAAVPGEPSLPCYTAPADGTRTTGQLQTLQAALDGIDQQQGGDATLPQLEAIRTQAAVATARMDAQLAEMGVRIAEESNRRSVVSLQRRAARRAQDLANYRCQLDNGVAGGLNLDWVAVSVTPRADGTFNLGQCVQLGR